MNRIKALLFLLVVLIGANLSPAQTNASFPELSSLLSLFSAHALPAGGVRINWTLEQQSPTIMNFRIYRGYEDLGNFAVLSDVAVHPAADRLDYSFPDTTALPGVSYFYKLAAVGQSSESVFPVVISATPRMGDGSDKAVDALPVMILPGNKISLYVLRPGHVKLELLSGDRKSLVDDTLRPGIYEFDPPAAQPSATLHLEHDSGYEADVSWPVE